VALDVIGVHGSIFYAPAERRVARLIAALRDSGSTAKALNELSRRSAEIDDLSRRRLRATAALEGYLATYYS
jgi:hypothetical protein